VLIPAVALTAGTSQNFRSPHHGAHAAHADTRLVDVALATAAAPLMFPVARIGHSEYVDGGLIAHAPDALALHEAQTFFRRRSEDVFMLSVGTTRELVALPAGAGTSRGLLWWMRRNRLMETIMGAQQALSQQSAQEALGERYVSINTPRSRHQGQTVALDRANAKAIATLKAMAAHALEHSAGNAQLTRILAAGRSSARE
jgi:predicted acylesterase/phospholipase RssA